MAARDASPEGWQVSVPGWVVGGEGWMVGGVVVGVVVVVVDGDGVGGGVRC
jgi:hypothetical protein